MTHTNYNHPTRTRIHARTAGLTADHFMVTIEKSNSPLKNASVGDFGAPTKWGEEYEMALDPVDSTAKL